MFSRHGTLVVSTVATVTFPNDCRTLEVMNRSSTDSIYFLVDPGATNPTVGGNNTWVCAPSSRRQVTSRSAGANTVVKLISSGAVLYSVTDLD